MFSGDISYYEHRLMQERFQTLIAERGDVATVHRKLALLYEERLEDLKASQRTHVSKRKPLSPIDGTRWSDLWNRQPACPSADVATDPSNAASL